MAERCLARCGGDATHPLRRLAGAEISATAKSCSHACLPAGITRSYGVHNFTRQFRGSSAGRDERRRKAAVRCTSPQIRTASIVMTQSIAGRPSPELTVPYWIDAEGKERPTLTLKELGTRHRLLFFYQHCAPAATRTDFQLSKSWFRI